MKIIIIGAGQGGMQAAKVLAKNGHDVTVYEKSKRELLCHDQIDVVEAALFDDLMIPVPERAYKSHIATFVAPDKISKLNLDMPEDKRSWSIERRIFAKELCSYAENEGAKFIFETEVSSLVFENDAVVGVMVNGEEIRSDLVIDSSGIMSPFRASFKGKYGITEMPNDNEVINIWHAHFNKTEIENFDDEFKFYLKYAGLPGISWCGVENSGNGDEVSILVGKIGPLSEAEKENALRELREDNPIIGDTLLRGGHYTKIPVRYPAPIMVSEGYAGIGDSVFMTMPLIGNGIANSVRAGQLLAEAIESTGKADIETLWQYNVRYYQKIGVFCCLIDLIKRALIKENNDDINFLFSSGIVTNEMISSVLYGEVPNISVNEIIDKIKNLIKARKAVGVLGSYLMRGLEAMLYAGAIPRTYDKIMIYKWKHKMESIFKNK